MKKILTMVAVAALSLSASAQLPVFNHVGVDLSVGTTGIGIEASTTLTDWVQMRAGVSIMPDFGFSTSFDGTAEFKTIPSGVDVPAGYTGPWAEDFSADVRASLGRTQGSVIFNVYPAGRFSKFFIAAGAYFGGKSIVKLEGHSDDVAKWQEQGLISSSYIEVGDYKVNLEEGGKVRGALVTKSFRPYLGLGFGRPCPRSRVGFMVELGVQFHGKMKVCEGKDLQPIDLNTVLGEDGGDWQKYMDKITAYPVLKFTLSGRIF